MIGKWKRFHAVRITTTNDTNCGFSHGIGDEWNSNDVEQSAVLMETLTL